MIKKYLPLLFTLLAPSVAYSAITISITGESTSSTATVTLSGSVSALSGASGRVCTDVRLPSGGSYLLFSIGRGQPSTNPFSIGQTVRTTGIGPAPDTATVTYNTSFGPTVAVPVHNFIYSDVAGSFGLIFPSDTLLPSIATNDMIDFTGSFDLDLGANEFSSVFNDGTHVGSYGTDTVAVVVTSTVPEPSSSLLALLGTCSLMRRRR